MGPIYLDHSATTPIHPEVLAALGMDEALAVGTLRFNMGRDNTRDEILRTVSTLKKLVNRQRVLAELEDGIGGRGCR
jgi:cysteine sulfinate desulfinase/cysteine desulfurase-like protein